MTTPTPDASGNIAPAYYHAEGDPPETVRYWDGTQWTGQPMPPPPGTMPAAGGAFAQDRFGSVGIRIGAVVIDGLLFGVLSVLLLLPFIEDTNSDANAFEFQATGIGSFIGPLVVLGLTILLVATQGGSPGKLMLGLRIATAEGTSPVGFGPATIRVLPWLFTLIPLLGVLVWLGVVITSLVFISNDPERRSVFDRVANTRVVYKARL
jgi:uncharacterized RDD family membrane protein YckC